MGQSKGRRVAAFGEFSEFSVGLCGIEVFGEAGLSGAGTGILDHETTDNILDRGRRAPSEAQAATRDVAQREIWPF